MTPEVDYFIENIENKNIQNWTITLLYQILELLPDSYCTIKYGVPFIVYHGNLCYFSPYKAHLVIGFVQGYQLSNMHGILEGQDLKQIRKLVFRNAKDLHHSAISEIILEAAMINEIMMKKKTK